MEEARILQMVETMRRSGKYSALRKKLLEMNAVDIARILNGLPIEDLLRVLGILPGDAAAGVFSYLEEETKRKLAAEMADSELEALIDKMFLDDAAAFLRCVDADTVKRALARLDAEKREALTTLLAYPRSSAGSLMTVECIELGDGMTAGEALASVRKTGGKKETADICCCVDYARRLVGTVSLRALLASDEKALVGDICDGGEKLVCVGAGESVKKAAQLVRKYDLVCLPVIGEGRKLAGIITVDDILDAMPVRWSAPSRLWRSSPSRPRFLLRGR